MADDPKLWVALGTSGIALAGTLYATITNHRQQNKQDRFKADAERELAKLKSDLDRQRDQRLAQSEADKILSKFSGPLMHAAYDLQSRIFNIVKQVFLRRYYINGTRREQQYAVENTVFLIAQFFGWTEAIRESIQFLDLGTDNRTKLFRELQDKIYNCFLTDVFGSGFRIFAGEQRAIGELMIDRTSGSPRCLGFANFSTRDPALKHWLDPLRKDIKAMAIDTTTFAPRLVAIQHSMIDLLNFLDKDFVHFSSSTRTKI